MEGRSNIPNLTVLRHSLPTVGRFQIVKHRVRSLPPSKPHLAQCAPFISFLAALASEGGRWNSNALAPLIAPLTAGAGAALVTMKRSPSVEATRSPKGLQEAAIVLRASSPQLPSAEYFQSDPSSRVVYSCAGRPPRAKCLQTAKWRTRGATRRAH